MYCFYINSVEGEVKGGKVGFSGTCFELFVRQFYSTLILNGKDMLMVRFSLISCSIYFLA
jgi:hypothetical protein